MPATPWSSSLVSDRLRPRSPAQKQSPNKAKGKGRANNATQEPPKSQPVRSLEARLAGAREFTGRPRKDLKGGCFCQCMYHCNTLLHLAHSPPSAAARAHALSPDVPICQQCGLILCTLNPAHCACPHCSQPLVDSRARSALVEKLEAELAAQLAKEEEERQGAIEEARAAEGAFPTLPGSRPQKQMASRSGTPQPSTRTQTPHAAATRTVLSLNSTTGKVKVSSFSTPTVAMSRSASRGEDRDEEGRVPGPPGEVSYVKEPLDPVRPWRNIRAGDLRYIPLPGEKTGEASSKRGRKKKRAEQGTIGGGQGYDR